MKILSNLNATVTDAAEPPPAGIRQGAHFSRTQKGKPFWINIAILGDGSVTVRTVKDSLIIPVKELLALADKTHPGLVPPNT